MGFPLYLVNEGENRKIIANRSVHYGIVKSTIYMMLKTMQVANGITRLRKLKGGMLEEIEKMLLV